MSLLDELIAASGRRGPTCSIDAILQTMDEATADDWRRALADPRVVKSVAAAHLRKLGYPVGNETVQRHAGGRCRCPSMKT